jgi:hypothetical protein
MPSIHSVGGFVRTISWCVVVFSTLAILNLSPAIAQDSSLLVPGAVYPLPGWQATGVAAADLNGDGKQDLVITNCTSKYDPEAGCAGAGSVAVLLGKGDGTFQPPVFYDAGACDTRAVAVGDVNRDGKMDVVLASISDLAHCDTTAGPGTISVLLGNGDGTFQPATTYSSGGQLAWSVGIADVNADGKPDLVAVNSQVSPTVVAANTAVLRGNGDGTFQPAVTYTLGGLQARSVAVADVNGDGRPDIVVAVSCETYYCGRRQGWLAVLINNGDGTFQSAINYDSGGDAPESVVVADLNGDGRLDLATVNYFSGTAGVLLGNGDGTFQPVVAYDTGGGGSAGPSIVSADINGDGKPDLIVDNWNGVAVLLGYGDGTFQTALTYTPSQVYEDSIAVADLNGDGKPDLAAVGGNYSGSLLTGSVAVLLNNSGRQNTTTTAVAASFNPSVYGEPVSLTVHVSSPSGTPVGTAEILNGSTVVGSGTLVGGSISIPVSTLPAGTNVITAAYLGSVDFAPSRSSQLTQTVTKATTTTSLSSSLNPAGTNQHVDLTATVTGQFGGATAGAVQFMAGSQVLGNLGMNGGPVVLTKSFGTTGTYSISAQYSGDSNNLASSSATLKEKILVATTTRVTSSLNPSVVGQAVTFSATVSASSGMPPNGESITFYNGSVTLGTALLMNGIAALTTSALPAGLYTISASYSGDGSYVASSSTGLKQTVNDTVQSATATTLVSSLNPSIYGQKVTFTSRVTTSGPVPPTGTVVFKWKYFTTTYTIGSATLNSAGVATLTKSNLNADPYPIIAVYRGDTNNFGSTSAVLNQTVLQGTSEAALTSSVNPSMVGQAVTFTARILSTTVIPTGPVTFRAGTTVLGTAQLSENRATFTTSSLPPGSIAVKATYTGNSNIKGSSASLTQTVQP